MRHHITFDVQDYDSTTGQPVGVHTVAESGADEAEFHTSIEQDAWPPCLCPRHFDPATGRGTHLASPRLIG